jgi:hypothetical protein
MQLWEHPCVMFALQSLAPLLYLQTQFIRIYLSELLLLNVACSGLHCYPSYVICFMGLFYQALNCHPGSFISILYVSYVFPPL